jgi:hypothetical protein
MNVLKEKKEESRRTEMEEEKEKNIGEKNEMKDEKDKGLLWRFGFQRIKDSFRKEASMI